MILSKSKLFQFTQINRDSFRMGLVIIANRATTLMLGDTLSVHTIHIRERVSPTTARDQKLNPVRNSFKK